MTLLIVVIIVCYRRPDQVLRPSFSYEAGTVFFMEDRAYGVKALLTPPAEQVGGYLVTIPRLVAFLGGFVDLEWVPVFYNLCACAFLLGLATLCIYARIDSPYRRFLALGLVLVPNGGEVFLDMNLLHFLCAPALVLLMLQRDASSRREWIIDFVTLILVGLTGPFIVLFLVPLLGVRFYRSGATRYNIALAAVAVLLAAIQLSSMVYHGRLAADLQQTARPTTDAPTAVTPALLWQVVSVAFAGPFLFGNVLPIGMQPLGWLATILLVGGLAFIAYRAKPEIRLDIWLLIAVAALMYGVQLYRSRTFLTYDHPFYAGQRYYFLPYVFLCWAWIIACQDKGWVRILAGSFLSLMLLSAATQFSRPIPPDTRWRDFARLVKRGYEVNIPINPPGWVIRVGPNDRGKQLQPGHNVGYHPDWKLGPVNP